MIIKSFVQFCEAISGTELIGQMGPVYGDTRLQNKTIYNHHTNVIYSDLDDKFYTIDEYNDIYDEYLKKGGSTLEGFSKENIDKILTYLRNRLF